MRVVISEFMDGAAVARLAGLHSTHYDENLVDRRGELKAQLASAHALIVRNRTRVDAELIACAPMLRVIGRLGVGLDNIDVEACAARGIEVIPAFGANTRAVAEYVLAAALVLLRGAYGASAAVAGGDWPRGPLSNGREIAGKTLGIVGFGAIGRAVAALARGVSMRVSGCDSALAADAPDWAAAGVEPCGLEELLAGADVVTLHVPLASATRGMLDARRLALMKPDAILINTSRGGIVDESALAAALRSGRLGGAALDVFAVEPLSAGSALAGCPNLLLTPHIAGLTREANVRVSTLIAEKVAAALAAAA
jgi:(S)-sulfolactate dehydrogenase